MAEKESDTVTVNISPGDIDQNFDAPFIWIDGAHGIVSRKNGSVMQIALYQDIIVAGDKTTIPSRPVQRKIVARLIMERATMRQIGNWLHKNTKDHEPDPENNDGGSNG